MASTDNTRENENKRKRLTQACELCRRKKIKCDGGKPTCGNCVRLNNTCTYSSSNKKRGPRQGYIEMLEQRLAKMEQILLSDSKKTESNAENQASSDGEDDDAFKNEEASKIADDTAASKNIPGNTSNSRRKCARKRSSEDTIVVHDAASPTSFSSISSNFPSPPAHMVNHYQHHQQQQQQPPPPPPPHQPHTQPSQENCNETLPMDVIEHMVDLYFTYLFSGTPIFDETILRADIRDRKCSDFLLLSLFAACARFSDRPDVKETPAWHAGEKYAEKARGLILKAVDEPSISNLQGLTLLCLHEYGCGRGPRSWMYGGMAIRMAMELGLHEDLDEDENGNDNHTLEKLMQQETRRRLFWTIYSIDKFSSAATGRPSSLQDTFCTAFLPAKVDDMSSDQYYTETLDNSRFVLLNVNGFKETQLLGSTLLSCGEGNSNSTNKVDNPPAYSSTSPSSSPAVVGLAYGSRTRPPLNCFAYLIRATSLLGRVTAFINSKAKDQQQGAVPPCHPDSEFSKLDRAIAEWYEQLPMHLKNSPANFEKPSLVIADSIENQNAVQPEIKAFVQESVQKCMTAVDNVTLLLKEIGKFKELMPPFITYLAYTVATVVVSTSFSSSPREADKAKQALGVYFQLLLAARNLWAMADKLYFMIRDLYAIHTNVLRRQLKDKESKTNPSELNQQQQMQQQMQQHQQQLRFQQEQQIRQQIQQQHQQQQQQQQHQQHQQQQQQHEQLQQFQMQQFVSPQTSLSTSTIGLADWTLPYYSAAMSFDTPDLDRVASQLELEFANVNNVFQIPEGYDQPLMFPSTSLNFDNNNSSSNNL
ncbi:hypothetical protein [Parasitella parasitica]|uniref:Zn(2)-C6 fungal-type domain-containing protein n=1 Tax=Parasitella parasitica TaxID=35722 RepID=A0A0B7NHH3_9FUNG|nr:hypothetical protein [Parasitella parasitica]